MSDILLEEQATPSTPSTNQLLIYPKADGLLYIKDDAGLESQLFAVSGTLPVTSGGTGRATSTTAYGLITAGTTATGAHQTLAVGLTTEMLVGGGTGALPVWTTATGSGAPVRAVSPTFATGTITASSPAITQTQTWNSGGVTFVGSTISITDTASAAASVIQNWQIGGSDRMSLRKDGQLTLAAGLVATTGVFSSTLNVTGRATVGQITVSSDSYAVGSIYRSASLGLVFSGVTGSTYDFLFINGAGQTVLGNLTGTQNLFAASGLSVGGGLTLSGGTLLTTAANLTNGAAVAAGTLLNAPIAGDPTKWVPVNDNGITRYIPMW